MAPKRGGGGRKEKQKQQTPTSNLIPKLPPKLRASVVESTNTYVTAIRQSVLRGGFFTNVSYGATRECWFAPDWKLNIFVSSTFTDTIEERNILIDEILPVIRNQGAPHQIAVVFVDMRWGVRDENTIDHRTWLECSREIQRCQNESIGISLLSLQSDKYGYRPLPREISEQAFAGCFQALSDDEEVKQLANEWYKLDSNSIPPRYVLMTLRELGDARYWNHAYPKLLAAMTDLVFHTPAHDPTDEASVKIAHEHRLLVGRSITEWEIKTALYYNSCSTGSSGHSYHSNGHSNGNGETLTWLHRHFTDIASVTDKNYNDVLGDKVISGYLDDLKAMMNKKISATNVVHTVCAYKEDSSVVTRTIQLAEFKKHAMTMLMQSITTSIDLRLAWIQHGCGVARAGEQWTTDGDGDGDGGFGEDLSEWLHHSQWAYKKCTSFEGRHDLLVAAFRFIQREDNRIDPGLLLVNADDDGNADDNADDANEEERKTNKYVGLDGLCLSILGVSGAGKTALMAKLAAQCFEWQSHQDEARLINRPILIRFCGTSGGSKDAR